MKAGSQLETGTSVETRQVHTTKTNTRTKSRQPQDSPVEGIEQEGSKESNSGSVDAVERSRLA